MTSNAREARVRRAAERQDLTIFKARLHGPQAFGRWWVTSGGEPPIADLKYAVDLGDIERLLAAALPPGFALVRLYDGAAERHAWIIAALVATTGDQHVYRMPDDRIGVYDTGQGLLDVFADEGEFLGAGYDEDLTAQVAGALSQETATK